MTNFQPTPGPRLSRPQVLVGVPALVAALTALGLAAGWVWPRWQQLQSDQRQLQALQASRDRLPLLLRQLGSVERQRDRAEQHNREIVSLIAGSGDLSTLLAQLSTEAAATGVLLDRYEPLAATPTSPGTPTGTAPAGAATPGAAPAAPNARTTRPVKAPPDPLLAPGLSKTTVLLTARGSGPQLLQFLRRLELLSVLVVQSDLEVKAGAPTELRLNLSLYGEARPSSPGPGSAG